METSLHSSHLTADDLASLETRPEVEEEEIEHHIHLPNPSLWPLILSVAIFFAVGGLLFIPDSPWLTIIAAPFVLIGILGWALEDPMGVPHDKGTNIYTYTANLTPRAVLELAEEVVDHNVTISSTAYSTHPVKVEIDEVKDDGIVLALYGKVELETQREQVEKALRALPNVLDVRNFVIAEDAILNIATARLENLRSKSKLEGASNISILVENYILHLYGDVPTTDMKYQLEREMIGIPGVRVVVNHIGLNKDIPGNLGRTRNKI